MPYIIHLIALVIWVLVLARVVFSWLPASRYHPVVLLVHSLTEPLLRPFRSLVPPWRTGGLDLSPILLLVTVSIIERVVVGFLP